MLQSAEQKKENPASLLGWGIQRIPKEEITKWLHQEERSGIAELRSGEKRFLLSGFPVLSGPEASIVREVLELFQTRAAKKKGRSALSELLNGFLEKNRLELEPEQMGYLLFVLQKMAFGLGPLEELLENDELEEIALTGTGPEKTVWVFHRNFGWLSSNLFFSDAVTVKNLVNRMARRLGRRLSMQTPRLNAVLENGSRIHAVIEPIAFSEPAVTIRKFRFQPFTPLDLLRTKTANSEILAFLWLALQSDCTVLVCGNTGSGKTTSLNALFYFVPKTERIILVEETPEMRLPHSHQVRLTSSQELEVSMHSLIIDSLRMRPDRVIVGEMRTASETKAFIDTLLAGQGRGSYATFHAQSISEAIFRMDSMQVPEMDLASIDLVLVQKRWTRTEPGTGFRQEERKIVEIGELELDQGRLRTRLLWQWQYAENEWEKLLESRKTLEKIGRSFGFSAEETKEELRKRKQWLETNSRGSLSPEEFFGEVNAYY